MNDAPQERPIGVISLLPPGSSTDSVIREALESRGLIATDIAGAIGLPHLVLFDSVDELLHDCIRETSRNGAERVLAVAAGGGSLSDMAVWEILRDGAADVVAWTEASRSAAVIDARVCRWDAIDRIVDSKLVRTNLIGASRQWLSVLRQIVEVARFTDAPILIMGESGTGKELVARLIHTIDARPSKRDLVVLDCTTVVPELSGSEFFGHERGAFTNALTAREGAFAIANGGTLFLDEVGELPLRLQAELLRAVQEKSYKRVGSNEWKKVDFRLICATNRDVRSDELSAEFRRDFFYRIAGWICTLPSLRDRTEDIIPLAQHFVAQKFRQGPVPELDEHVQSYLLTREYPGNIRDLKQLVARILCRHVGPGPITVGCIPQGERPGSELDCTAWQDERFESAIRRALSLGVGMKEIGKAASDMAIDLALVDEQGNIQRAARRLGVTDRALQMRRAEKRNGSVCERDAD